MKNDLLIVIDGYLSTPERAQVCSKLIDQIKSVLPYKIALFNKFSFSWGLDSKIDYYWSHTGGFMIGSPPQEYLDKELYERPYVYVKTDLGTHENWLPLVGVQDHTANIFNSFIFSSVAAKNLGYKRIFRIEADTEFNLDDLKSLIPDLESFEDYLLYGERQEGDWAKPHHRIMDAHIVGYSVDLFNGFDVLHNDDDFWKLCEKINYYGKWIEYIIPTTIYYQKQISPLKGINHPGSVRDQYPNSKFDLINNPGGWVNKWKNQPKVCKVLLHKDDKKELTNKFGLFYWNEEDKLEVNCKVINLSGEEIYNKNITLDPFTWAYDELSLNEEYTIINTNIRNGIKEEFITKVSSKNILDFNTRFIKE
jgi:hypothetical protein